MSTSPHAVSPGHWLWPGLVAGLLHAGLSGVAADFVPDPTATNRPLAVPADGRVLVPLVRTGGPTTNSVPDLLDVQVVPFRDPLTGESLPAQLVLPGYVETPAPMLTNLGVAPATARLDLVLLASEPAGTNACEGALWLRQNQGPWTRHPLSLRRRAPAAPAVPALDFNTLETALVNPWWGVLFDLLPGRERALGRFTVRLREKSGLYPLEGLTVRLEQLVKAPAPGFDLARHLDFGINGQPVPDLAVWPAESASQNSALRRIPAGGQAEITGTWRGLSPGEYQLTLRFAAANAAESEAAKLTLTTRVRHGWFFAVLTLVLALGLSWFLTKFMVFARRRLALRQRLDEVPAITHPAYRNLPAAVWVRALLGQVRRLSERHWLSGLDVLEAKLRQAAALAAVFQRAEELRRQLDATGRPNFVANRVRSRIENLLGNLATLHFDDAARDATLATLDALKVWLDDALYVEQYRADLDRDARRLVNRVRPDLIAEATSRQKIEDLRIACVPQPTDDLAALLRREEAYARLKVLWERRDAPEFGDLAAHAGHIEDFFRLADEKVWERLQQAHRADRLRVKAPEDAQAFHDVRFEVVPDAADLNEAFLFRHGLCWEWEWSFTPEPTRADGGGMRAGWERFRRAVMSGPAPARRVETTNGPCLVQFAPAPGRLEGEVTLRWKERSLSLPCPPVRVTEAREFGVLRGFETLEVWSTLLALGLALASGLAGRFFNVPTFGAPGDYLALFLWGVGVDQAKNAWQLFSSQAPPAGK